MPTENRLVLNIDVKGASSVDKSTASLKKHGTQSTSTARATEKSAKSNKRSSKSFNVMGLEIRKASSFMRVFRGNLISFTGVRFNLQNIISPFKSLIKTGAAFEQSLKNLQLISSATASEMANMKTVIDDLGGSTSFTQTQIATTAKNLASLGLSSDEIVSSLEAVVKGAGATGLSVEKMGTGIAVAGNVFGISAEDMADVFVQLQNSSAATAEDLTKFGKRGYLAIKSLDIPLREGATLFGELRNKGLSAKLAATAFQGVQKGLAAQTLVTQKALGKIGIEFEKFRDLPFVERMEQVQSGLAGIESPAERSSVAIQIFGTSGVGAYEKLVTEGEKFGDTLERLNARMDSSIGANEQYEKSINTVTGRSAIFGSTIEAIGNKFYDLIKGPLKRFIEYGTKVATKIKEMDFTPFVDSILWVVAGIGPWTEFIWQRIKYMADLISPAVGAIWDFGKQQLESFATVIKEFYRWIEGEQSLWTTLKNSVSLVWTNAKKTGTAYYTWMKDTLKPYVDTVFPGAWTKMETIVSDVWSGISTVAKDFYGWLTGTFMTWLSSDDAEGEWRSMGVAGGDAWSSIKKSAEAVYNFMKDTIYPYVAVGFLVAWNTLRDTVKLIWNSIDVAIETVWVIMEELSAWITTDQDTWTTFGNIAEGIWGGIMEQAENLSIWLKDVFGIDVGAAIDSVVGTFTWLKARAGFLMKTTINKIAYETNQLWVKMVKPLEEMTDKAIGYFRDLWKKVVGESYYPDMVREIGTQNVTLKKDLVSIGETVIKVEENFKSLKEAGVDAMTHVTKAGNRFSDTGIHATEIMAQSFNQVETFGDKLKSTWKGVVDAITGYFDQIDAEGKTMGKKWVENISKTVGTIGTAISSGKSFAAEESGLAGEISKDKAAKKAGLSGFDSKLKAIENSDMTADEKKAAKAKLEGEKGTFEGEADAGIAGKQKGLDAATAKDAETAKNSALVGGTISKLGQGDFIGAGLGVLMSNKTFQKVMGKIANILVKSIGPVLEALEPVFEEFIPIFELIGEMMVELAPILKELAPVFKLVLKGIKTAFGLIKVPLSLVAKGLTVVAGWIAKLANGINSLFEGIKNLISALSFGIFDDGGTTTGPTLAAYNTPETHIPHRASPQRKTQLAQEAGISSSGMNLNPLEKYWFRN